MKKLLKYLAKNILLKDFTSYKKFDVKNHFFSVSDFFPYRNDNFKTSIVLENSNAIFFAKKSNFIVKLIFFDRDGKECLTKMIKFNDYDISIDLSHFKKELDEYGGFYVSALTPSIFRPKYRGYIGLSLKKENFYSYVHGNFGHIFRSSPDQNKSLAKISKKYFYYTPQIALNSQQEFFILNPYEVDLNVNFYKKINRNFELIENKSIPAFGSHIFRYTPKIFRENYPLPVFHSKSPTLRAIVFEKCPNGSFDVFHS